MIFKIRVSERVTLESFLTRGVLMRQGRGERALLVGPRTE